MMPKYHYKVVVNRGWVGWWGLASDYEKQTQNVVDHWNSKGWDLHSFSLRNGMMPNTGIIAILVRLIIRCVTLGFMVYEYGGVWVFKKELEKSLSRSSTVEPTL